MGVLTSRVPEALLGAADRVRHKVGLTERTALVRRAIAFGLRAFAKDPRECLESSKIVFDKIT